MTDSCDCCGGSDPRALVRAGVDRTVRAPAELDPASVPVDERRTAHDLVFAAGFAGHLRYFTLNDQPEGDWRPFFDSADAARIAAAAIGDVDQYRTTLHERFIVLENPDHTPSQSDDGRMAAALRDVFDAIGTLAARLDTLRGELPPAHPLRDVITNLIRTQLAMMLQRLIGCYLAGDVLDLVDPDEAPSSDVVILGGSLTSFSALLDDQPLSGEWPSAVGLDTWTQYIGVDPAAYTPLYGPPGGPSARINHVAAHNLFRSAADAFLAAFARVVDESQKALEASLQDKSTEPHYALFLAFLRLLGHSRDAINGFSANHLDFYYRQILRLSQRPAEPSHAHAVVQLAKHVSQHLVGEGALIKAGKDETGADAHFRVDRDLVANEASVEQVARLFRNPAPLPDEDARDRVYADTVATDAESWHPFAEKRYSGGAVTEIAMQPARVGFAIASHYLWMAEGDRIITVELLLASGSPAPPSSARLECRLTTEKELLEVDAKYAVSAGVAKITITLNGDVPPITPYDPAVHGYGFGTKLPVLVVLLEHVAGTGWSYGALDDVRISGIKVGIGVSGIRTLQLSNDHGPVDPSKPFLAFGSAPRTGSSFVVGSKEIFQKSTSEVRLRARYPFQAVAHPTVNGTQPTATLQHLSKGAWGSPVKSTVPAVTMGEVVYKAGLRDPLVEQPDLSPNEPYSTASRSGFLRLRLDGGFGTDTYPLALAKWTVTRSGEPPSPPVLPTIESLTAEYDASTQIALGAPSEARGRFFHITPFGHASPKIVADVPIPLLPQFQTRQKPSEGELYLGIEDLRPPQDLSVLFQVIDGTADPRMEKPAEHISWSYLRADEWVDFEAGAVSDGTEGLLASGIVTISMPDDATTEHTLLPAGLHWLRLSVSSGSDAVCRVATVRTQALRATATDASARSTDALPAGTLTKLDRPDAAVKAIEQPYPTFGGRPAESPEAFRTRVSERLRHKDRAIALWDYEHLILERFPSIYQARCLNHTRYEPTAGGDGIYSELAPGHITVVTIPDLAVPDQRDPLRPFTSLGVLTEIDRFLTARMNCFADLHVCNPQFEDVRAELRVRLREGTDEAYHLALLSREITEFLSPWAFRSHARPRFNGRVRKSVLIDFIEERPYVDYITDVQLFHLVPGQEGTGRDLDEVTGSRAISILVSANKHGILPIHEHPTAAASADCGCTKAVRA